MKNSILGIDIIKFDEYDFDSFMQKVLGKQGKATYIKTTYTLYTVTNALSSKQSPAATRRWIMQAWEGREHESTKLKQKEVKVRIAYFIDAKNASIQKITYPTAKEHVTKGKSPVFYQTLLQF